MPPRRLVTLPGAISLGLWISWLAVVIGVHASSLDLTRRALGGDNAEWWRIIITSVAHASWLHISTNAVVAGLAALWAAVARPPWRGWAIPVSWLYGGIAMWALTAGGHGFSEGVRAVGASGSALAGSAGAAVCAFLPPGVKAWEPAPRRLLVALRGSLTALHLSVAIGQPAVEGYFQGFRTAVTPGEWQDERAPWAAHALGILCGVFSGGLCSVAALLLRPRLERASGSTPAAVMI